MKRWISLVLLLCAGCAAPYGHFTGAAVTRVSVADSVFDVRVRGELAEAVRRNPQYAPRFGPIRARAGFAMAQVSGCRVTSVLGDQAVAVGTLDCDGIERVWPWPGASGYSCVEVGQWLNDGTAPYYSEYDCDPV